MAVLFKFMSFMIFLFGKSLTIAAVISPSNGSFCNGVTRNFTCEVNGTSLAWVFGNNVAVFGSVSMVSQPLNSSINTHFVSAGGGTVVAIATVTASSGLNGATLECRNTTGVISTTARTFVNFTFEASSAATSIALQYNQFNDNADINLEGATCIQYNINVNGDLVAMTTGPSYRYTFSSRDRYDFEVFSVDYFGNILGVLTENYYWELYDYTLSVNIKEDENSANFKVQGLRANQPPINNCTITVVGKEPQSCRDNVPVTFNNVMLSSDTNITYNITIVNDAGVSSYINTLSGDLLVNVTHTVNNSMTTEIQGSIGDPVIFASPFIVLGVLIVLSVCWIVLRICWKRQCCCPGIWRSGFWLIFFCYDCCTYDTQVKEGDAIGLKNPNVGGEKGTDTSL